MYFLINRSDPNSLLFPFKSSQIFLSGTSAGLNLSRIPSLLDSKTRILKNCLLLPFEALVVLIVVASIYKSGNTTKLTPSQPRSGDQAESLKPQLAHGTFSL